MPKQPFLININYHKIPLRTFLCDIKIFHSVIAPPTCPPMGPPSISPLTLIFIFYYFCINAFETIDARHFGHFYLNHLSPLFVFPFFFSSSCFHLSTIFFFVPFFLCLTIDLLLSFYHSSFHLSSFVFPLCFSFCKKN